MRDVCYLVFHRYGVARMTKNPPRLERDEYAVQLNVMIEDAFFKAAIPIATLEIGDEHVIKPSLEVMLEPAEQQPGEPSEIPSINGGDTIQ